MFINIIFAYGLTFSFPMEENKIVVSHLVAINHGLGGSDTILNITNNNGVLEFLLGSAEGRIDGLSECNMDIEELLVLGGIRCKEGFVEVYSEGR
ncbi:hypothetical protein [Reinekea sp.]|uniref:hypothetical protein n=1 Tax=Reinekea sp. TaxID=1970455 RepID=UPI00257E6A30|nr:hypothetical protein [Reinekea sp.]